MVNLVPTNYTYLTNLTFKSVEYDDSIASSLVAIVEQAYLSTSFTFVINTTITNPKSSSILFFAYKPGFAPANAIAINTYNSYNNTHPKYMETSTTNLPITYSNGHYTPVLKAFYALPFTAWP